MSVMNSERHPIPIYRGCKMKLKTPSYSHNMNTFCDITFIEIGSVVSEIIVHSNIHVTYIVQNLLLYLHNTIYSVKNKGKYKKIKKYCNTVLYNTKPYNFKFLFALFI